MEPTLSILKSISNFFKAPTPEPESESESEPNPQGISDNCVDGTCDLISNFIDAQKTLYVSRKAQSDLAETVLNNIREIADPVEKVQLLKMLRWELLTERDERNRKRSQVVSSLQAEMARLETEIGELVGQTGDQGERIKEMLNDLNSAGSNRVDALRSLSKRYEIDTSDIEMQADLIRFVSSVERAARLYSALLQIIDIADQVQTTEEKIHNMIEINTEKLPKDMQDPLSHNEASGLRHFLKTLVAKKSIK